MKGGFLDVRRKQQAGAVITEFALSLPIFLLIIFSGVELLFMSHQVARFDYALNQAGRYATLGHTKINPAVPNQDFSVKSVKSEIVRVSGMSVSHFSICPIDNCATNSRGNVSGSAAPEWIKIEATSNISLLFDLIRLPYKSQILVRNEPKFSLTPNYNPIQ